MDKMMQISRLLRGEVRKEQLTGMALYGIRSTPAGGREEGYSVWYLKEGKSLRSLSVKGSRDFCLGWIVAAQDQYMEGKLLLVCEEVGVIVGPDTLSDDDPLLWREVKSIPEHR